MRSTTYDALQRLVDIIMFNAQHATLNAHRYDYNAANQRTRRTEADGSYWDYGYDSLGQVTAGWKRWSDGTLVAGQQYSYEYDDIGNRERSEVNGQRSDYTANALNQYTQRTVPGVIWELGTAHSNATVTVNNQPTSRRGEYFAKAFAVNNSGGAVYTQLTTVAVLKNAGPDQKDIVSSVTGRVFVAKSPEIFGYDADGNLTNDCRFAYTWDAENRLIEVETLPAAVAAGAPRQKLLLGYDHQSRRISKVVSNWTGSAWTLGAFTKFVYDGWNLLAELDPTNGVVRSYVWGLDLSGTEQGAGGIGGLLFSRVPRPLGEGSGEDAYAYAYDGNGNVVVLVDVGTQALSAAYEYGPFGELIRSTGPMAKANLFRFSTKYQDDETGLLYYGYRYYQPDAGRWLTKDPVNEFGFITLVSEGTGYDLEPEENLYRFVNNNPVSLIDKDGRAVPVVIVIGGATLTAVKAAALAAAAGVALCGADVHCRQAVEQAVNAAIGAVSSAVATVCKTRCRFKNEPDPHHYFWRPTMGIPPWKKCWMSHI